MVTPFDVNINPLGIYRLNQIDLILNLIKIKNNAINNALLEAEIFLKISELLIRYPWNNFLQQKVDRIYKEILEINVEEKDFRRKVLE